LDESDHQDGTSDAWYLRLPEPWNVIPRKIGRRSDEQKIAIIDQESAFDGEQRNYLSWRTWVIVNIHKANLPVEDKFKLLRKSVKTSSNPLLKCLFTSVRGNAYAYEKAIKQMEDQWGGSYNVTQHVLNEIHNDGQVNLNCLNSVAKLTARLDNIFELEMDNLLEDINSKLLIQPILQALLKGKDLKKLIRWTRENVPGKANGGMPDLRDLHEWSFNIKQDLMTRDQVNNKGWTPSQPQANRKAYVVDQPDLSTFTVRRSFSQGATAGTDSRPASSRHTYTVSSRDQLPEEVRDAYRVEGDESSDSSSEGEEDDTGHDQVVEVHNSDDEERQEQAFLLPASYTFMTVREPECDYCTRKMKKPIRHLIKKCRGLEAMSVSDRINEMIRQKRCILCFGKGHTVKECKKEFRCKECNGMHNTFLHINFPRKSKQ